MASVHKREWTSRRGPQVRYRVMWRQDGRPEERSFFRQDHAETFRGLVEVYNEHLPPPHVWDDVHRCLADQSPSDKPTFRVYAEQAIAIRVRISRGTRLDYESQLRLHVYPALGDLHIDRIEREHLAQFVRDMTGKNLAAKTIANIHGLVASILNDAVIDGHLPRNPATGVLRDLPAVKTEDMVFLTPAEFSMILERIPEHYQPFTRFIVGTGMRWGEATALQVRDIDLFSRYPAAHVRRAWKNREYYELGEPKTNRSRRAVSLSPGIVELLIPYVASRAPDEFVFVNRYNHPIRQGDFYRLTWRPAVKAAQEAGLTKQPRIHDLRHTYASWLLNDGNDLVAIQRQLGHESITTTINRYSHLMPAHVEAINAAVDRALARQP